MRSHGVTDFPDPVVPSTHPGKTSYLGNGPNPSSSPTYDAASAACRKYAVAEPVTPAGAAKVMGEQIEYAECMRAHGVPAFPDPGANGGFTLPSSIDQNSPIFQAAQLACDRLQPGFAGPPGSGGG